MKTAPKFLLDNVEWHLDAAAEDPIPTCYLHSYTKAALTAIQAQEGQVDPVWVVGASGMAFRIWAHCELCPSATSVFDRSLLPQGVKNAGWHCDYHSRVWHEETVARQRQEVAHKAIVEALQEGKVPICWDIGIPEWGVIVGYDDEVREYSAISALGQPAQLKYEQLGQRDIPILSVTIIEGSSNADRRQAALNSLKTAVSHAEQGEWLKRRRTRTVGRMRRGQLSERLAHGGEQRMLRYYAGTYLAARYYARRYMDLVTGILGNTEPLEDATRLR